jgi:signal transduction histidine kinase/tetratricopeptide (TPR) repeat protein
LTDLAKCFFSGFSYNNNMQIRLKTFSFLLSLALFPAVAFSSVTPHPADSLFRVLEASAPDSNRAKTMVELCFWASQHDGRLLDSLSSELEVLSAQIEYPRGMAHAAAFQGIARYFSNDVKAADSLFHLAADRFEGAGEMDKSLTNRTKAGIMQMIQGDLEGALQVFNRSILLARKYDFSSPLAHALNEKATLFHYQGKRDSAAAYYQQAIEVSEAGGHQKHYDRALYNFSVLATEAGDLEQANQLLLKIYQSQKEANNSLLEQGKTLSAIGENYRLLGNYSQAIETLLQAAEALEKVGENSFIPITYINLSRMYLLIGDTTQFETYYDKAYSRARKANDQDKLIQILSERTSYLTDRAKPEEALQVFDEAISIARESDRQDDLITMLCQQAALLLSKGETGLARQSLQQAEEKVFAQSPPLGEKILALGWAQYYLFRKEYEPARIWANRAWELIEPKDNLQDKREATEYLYRLYKATSNTGQALRFFELERKFSDSLLNKDKIRDLAVAQYQAEKDLLVANARQQEELFLSEQKARASQRNAFLGGLLALGAILFVLYRNYRIKTQANQVLSEQNATIEAQRAKLDQLNQVKDRIFAILGHDLRKPALAFRGLSRKLAYLIRKEDYTTLRKVGEQLEADADALHSLTDNILHWALSQQEGYVYRPTTFDLAESVSEVVKIFQRAAEHKGVLLENQVQEPVLIKADPHATQAVLRNLLDNALKYTPGGGQVVLSAEQQGEKVKIRVKDSGEGISPEQQAKLFSLTAKSKTGTAGEQGTGLGLHLVKQLVQKNQGELVLHSELRKGTMVEISLPKAS